MTLRLRKLAQPFSSAGEGLRSSAPARNLRGWTPPLLLALGLASVFLFNSDRAHYYAPIDHHTAKTLALVENLSPQSAFRMFTKVSFGNNGEPVYELYHRFPIGGFALIKLAILPFGDNLAAKVFAARLLMLAFLTAAAFLAYHAVARIASNRWIAVAATLLAFSSYYVLLYNNWVSNELMMDLFGVMLTFHGMVVFIQEGRFRQLLIKTCVALLIGWHVYAFLAPFIILGLGSECIAAMRSPRTPASTGFSAGARSAACLLLSTFARSRYTRLGAAALLFGAALLAFNLISEYNALSGETPFRELPSVTSILGRVSGSQGISLKEGYAWQEFLPRQFYRVAGSILPGLAGWPGVRLEETPNDPPFPLVIVGILAAGASVIGLLFTRRNRLLLATLALSGFCWAFPMRGNTFYFGHQFEAIYYVGVPLTLVTLALLALGRFGRIRRLLPGVAAVAFILFTLSASQMIAKGPEEERSAARMEAVFSDLANIRKITQAKNVLVTQHTGSFALYGDDDALHFLLAGSRIRYLQGGLPAQYDFVLIPHHRDETTLTPANRTLFLYGPVDPAALFLSGIDSLLSSGEPGARSVFDLYLNEEERTLTYIKEPCADSDTERPFFLHIRPERAVDLPEYRREFGFDNLDFDFRLRGAVFEGKCAARVPLPEYPVSSIRTGQWVRGEGVIWEAVLRPSQ